MDIEFDGLISKVQECTACTRMCGSVRVLSWANGNPSAPLMFIGEAPGRLGADRTAIPFHGDKSGDNFERLLQLSGISRSDIFVTNAVLCNPRDEKGNNAPPSRGEIAECASHLAAQIALVQPKMVMTLGAVALEATRQVCTHSLSLQSVRTAHSWNGRILLPLYHPGARAMIHRSFANQTADYYFVGETFRRLGKTKKKLADPRGSRNEWSLVRQVLETADEISVFRLHKLMYLTELESLSRTGKRATNFLYLRQKDGPYCVELGSKWWAQFGGDVKVRERSGKLYVSFESKDLFSAPDEDLGLVGQIAKEVIAKVRHLTDAQIKTKTYLTRPMRAILRSEREGSKMLNRPLLLTNVESSSGMRAAISSAA